MEFLADSRDVFSSPFISPNEVSTSPVSSFKIQGQGHPTWQKKKRCQAAPPHIQLTPLWAFKWIVCKLKCPWSSRLGNLTPPHWLSLKVSWLPPRSTPPAISSTGLLHHLELLKTMTVFSFVSTAPSTAPDTCLMTAEWVLNGEEGEDEI